MGRHRSRQEDQLPKDDAGDHQDQVNKELHQELFLRIGLALAQYLFPYPVFPVFKRQMICKDLGISELLF